jgi:hypothetical protein
MNSGTLRLYRKTPNGVVNVMEYHRSMFEDSYNEAVDFAYLIGYSEDYPIDYGTPQGDLC